MRVYRTIIVLMLALALSSCGRPRQRFLQQEEVVIKKEIPPQPFIAKAKPKAAVKTIKPKELIMLDAGHGGKDTGTKSDKNRYEEKKLTLHTAKIVKKYLEELGYKVALTRNEDTFVSLTRRAELANAMNAALFVSIHYNYSENESAEGIEIFYYKDEKNPFSSRVLASQKLGEVVLTKIAKHTGATARGVKKANFAVVRETKMPAILIEAGFLSNPEERAKIKDDPYVCYLGWAIARGVDNYLLTRK